MTAQTQARKEHSFEPYIADKIRLTNALEDARCAQLQTYAKQFLDRVFPLARGSHRDVCSYLVYYQHLLAFFNDGSQSGLLNPGQFVALSGHKEAPTALVLKNGNDCHVELIINPQGEFGKRDPAAIDDIQVQTRDSSLPRLGSSAGHSNQHALWFSLLHSAVQTRASETPEPCYITKGNKEFTAKDGAIYRV